ncbi:unnamed protein product [Lactuca saligna]|uniref:Uncharacterized protein n=1 Tax=Lactuca saligna TaxID=75948 RepID=A0AA35Y4N3_LACSI|nr:unnamed protein product [Lactuca saligna]
MHQPITSLFSSQSTEGGKSVLEDEQDDDDVMVTKLRDIAKERHVIFVEKVTKVEASVNLKMEELTSEMSKAVVKIEQNYLRLHSKVDVLVDAIKKPVEYHTLFSTKVEAKTETNSKVFEKLEEFLGSLTESLSKLVLSQQSTISQDSILKMISSLESNLKEDLSPLHRQLL